MSFLYQEAEKRWGLEAIKYACPPYSVWLTQIEHRAYTYGAYDKNKRLVGIIGLDYTRQALVEGGIDFAPRARWHPLGGATESGRDAGETLPGSGTAFVVRGFCGLGNGVGSFLFHRLFCKANLGANIQLVATHGALPFYAQRLPHWRYTRSAEGLGSELVSFYFPQDSREALCGNLETLWDQRNSSRGPDASSE